MICDLLFSVEQAPNLRAQFKCSRRRRLKSDFSSASNQAKGRTLKCLLAHTSLLLRVLTCDGVFGIDFQSTNQNVSTSQVTSFFTTIFFVCFLKVCERCFLFDNGMNRSLEELVLFFPHIKKINNGGCLCSFRELCVICTWTWRKLKEKVLKSNAI